MASPIVKIKAISATRIKPKPTPDGTSLEERMNAFCATLSATNYIGLTVMVGQTADEAGDVFTGFIAYKG